MGLLRQPLLLLFLLFSVNGFGKVILPPFFSSDMVLQRLETVKIWGKGDTNTKITLVASWDGKKYVTRSDDKGNWSIKVNTPDAGGPYDIKISDGEPIILKNVLLGDVWLCSGQSNMEMPVKGFRGQPIVGSQETIVAANPKRQIRMFTVKRAYSTTPQDTLTGSWNVNNPLYVGNFSATAYFFGDLLEKTLDIPIGLIHSSWSASKIEAWMNQETLSSFPEINLPDPNQKEFGWPAGTPTLLYNAMIHPIKNLRIKGVVWYQGESNSSDPALYSKLFPAWMELWRRCFDSETMPFYYVQIAPYQADGKDLFNRAIFRESQLKSMKELSNVGMVITTDAGSEKFIHAPYKKVIGERLAFWALTKTYGVQGIRYCGPLYSSHQVKASKVEITFEYGEEGLTPENEDVLGFEIAGDDGVFYPATARIVNGSARIEVWHESVPSPKEVRYCFRNYKEGNLCDNVGLPASPFRIHL